MRSVASLICVFLVASSCGGSNASEVEALANVEDKQQPTSTTVSSPASSTLLIPTSTTSVEATAPTSTTSAEATAPTATVSAPAKDGRVATIPDPSELLASPIVDLLGQPGAGAYKWGEKWQPDTSDSECAEKAQFSIDELSARARINLELITEKDITTVTAQDLAAITQLQFSDALYANDYVGYRAPAYMRPEGLVSYDGLELLTCLQWLNFGIQNFGRDYRFLSSLSELRYLNLGSSYDFADIGLLKSMTELEWIVLPPSFRSLQRLAEIPSLRGISARTSRSCDVSPLLEMPKLETLLLGGNSDFEKWSQLDGLDRSFDLSVDPTGQYLQLLIEGGASAFNTEFDLDNLSGIHDTQYLMNVVQSVYQIADDTYDAIVFIGNADTHSASYNGLAAQVGNDINGLGTSVWSSASCYGSPGRLRGIVTISSIDALWSESGYDSVKFGYGSLIHEILHLWGGGNLLPVIEDFEGNIVGGHWGVSSVNGILGGFDLESLSVVDEGVYRADYFSERGHSRLDFYLSPLELYMMGLIPQNEVPDTTVFRGVSPVNDNNSCEDYGYQWWDGKCFRAEEKVVVGIQDIVDVFGERPYEGRLDISLLVVAVSEDPLTEAEWSQIDKHISWYVEPRMRDDFSNNMWEASGEKIKLLIPSIGP